MTCKELVVYILENDLLDRQVFEDGTFVGFVTYEDAAAELKLGPASMKVIMDVYEIESININGAIFLPCDFANKLLHLRKE